MKSLTHVEASLVSGGNITMDTITETFFLSEQSDRLTINADHETIILMRGDDGMVNIHYQVFGTIVPIPPENNLCRGQVGFYKSKADLFGFRE